MRPPVDRWVQGNDSGVYTSSVDKFLIHTTEGGSIDGAIAAYRTNNSWPHLTVDCRYGRSYVRCGHLDLDVPARSLRNEAGGVQTNRDGVIQVEVVGSATAPGDIDWRWFGENVLGPIAQLEGIQLTSTVRWVPYPASYGVGAAQRLSAASWTAYRGVLGHQHCPENSHGDPGAVPIVTILAAAGQTAAPEPSPVSQEDDDSMFTYDYRKPDGFEVMVLVAGGKQVRVTGQSYTVGLRDLPSYTGWVDAGTFARYAKAYGEIVG